MKTLLLGLLLMPFVAPSLQPAEETIVKFDKAQIPGLREDQRNKLDGPGAKSCGAYFLLLNEKEVAYIVKSGKAFSLRTSDIGTIGVEIDNKLKSPMARLALGAAGAQAANPLLRLSQKDYESAKACLPKPK